jgi:1,4-alpha-glucan branching enzyme
MPVKNYSKTGKVCRVTFRLPAAINAGKVSLCGNFNEWDPSLNPMYRRKDGSWSTTISLEAGKSYQFRYLIDGKDWENDWDADKYIPNSFGTEDSVIKV